MKVLFAAVLFAVLSISAQAQSTAKSKKDKIRALLEVTGSAKLGVQVTQSMVSAFKKMYTTVDANFWDEFTKEINADDLILLIIPIYDKHYTEEDLDQLIAFYSTPIGKKVVETLPIITQESMTAGQEWGKQIAKRAVQRLKEKGYLKE